MLESRGACGARQRRAAGGACGATGGAVRHGTVTLRLQRGHSNVEAASGAQVAAAATMSVAPGVSMEPRTMSRRLRRRRGCAPDVVATTTIHLVVTWKDVRPRR